MKEVHVELSVRLSDGKFEASFSFPLEASREQQERAVAVWLKAMEQALAFKEKV